MEPRLHGEARTFEDILQLSGVLGLAVYDSFGIPVLTEGPLLERKALQLSIGICVGTLWNHAGVAVDDPVSFFARYGRLGIFAQRLPTVSIVVLCGPEVALSKLRFVTNLSLVRLTTTASGPAAAASESTLARLAGQDQPRIPSIVPRSTAGAAGAPAQAAPAPQTSRVVQPPRTQVPQAPHVSQTPQTPQTPPSPQAPQAAPKRKTKLGIWD